MTAIVDAAFFIILIGIAAVMISQALAEDDRIDEPLSEKLDVIVDSRFDLRTFGYEDDNRIMKFTDLAAASLVRDDGKAMAFCREILDILYPWDNAYGVSIAYGGRVSEYNLHEGSTEECTRNAASEFGGDLIISLRIYG